MRLSSETRVLCVVGGVTGAASKTLMSVGKGVVALSANTTYKKKRQKSFARQTDNVTEGIARGGRRLVVVSIIVFHRH